MRRFRLDYAEADAGPQSDRGWIPLYFAYIQAVVFVAVAVIEPWRGMRKLDVLRIAMVGIPGIVSLATAAYVLIAGRPHRRRTLIAGILISTALLAWLVIALCLEFV